MGALTSAEMKYAITLVMEEGKSPYEAAKLAGVNPSSIYKSLKAKGKKIVKKRLAKSIA